MWVYLKFDVALSQVVRSISSGIMKKFEVYLGDVSGLSAW